MGGDVLHNCNGWRPAGRLGSKKRKASTPPVEAPIRINRKSGPLDGLATKRKRCPRGRFLPVPAWLAPGARRSFYMKRKPPRQRTNGIAPSGLAKISQAPASIASSAICEPCCVSALTTTTGMVDFSALSLRRYVSPSMRGISMSSVSTSGRSLGIFQSQSADRWPCPPPRFPGPGEGCP